jgi:uncharacterized ferritin-like protein (DUF455 family)
MEYSGNGEIICGNDESVHLEWGRRWWDMFSMDASKQRRHPFRRFRRRIGVVCPIGGGKGEDLP